MRHLKFICLFLFTLGVMVQLTAIAADSTVLAAELADPLDDDTDHSSQDQEDENTPVSLPLSETKVETHVMTGAHAGYRFLSSDSFGGRAAQYEYLHSSPTFGAFYSSLGRDNKFSLDGTYLNANDYFGELIYDYKSYYRIHLRTESFFHNLDHRPLFQDINNFFGSTYVARDLDPGANFGLRVEQDLASFRFKVNDYPMHFNLGFWRLTKQGDVQQIFADQAFRPVGAINTVYSQSRKLDRETMEGNIGLDAHAGPIDFIYNFKIRQFSNDNGILRSDFISRSDSELLAMQHNGGLLEHNEEPDSRFYSNTVKLHTSLAGGLVGSASYTLGKRTNQSKLTTVGGVGGANTTLHNAAGDVVYIPRKEVTIAVKYRRQETDWELPSSITTSFGTPSTLAIRPMLNSQKDSLIATLSIRPMDIFTIKGEYKVDLVQRENVDAWNNPTEVTATQLPGHYTQHQGTAAVLSRPAKGLRLKAQYSYTTVDNPSYGNSFGEKHEGQFHATYTLANRWGLSANCRVSNEKNDESFLSSSGEVSPAVTRPLGREKRTGNATTTVWLSPFDRFTLSGSYGYLRSNFDQAVLFSAAFPDSFDTTNFKNRSHIYSLNAVYHLSDKTELSLGLQRILSRSEFSPEFFSFTDPIVQQPGDTSYIKEISKVDMRENALTARASFQLLKNLSCTLDYTLRDLEDRSSQMFSGTVHAVIAYLSAKW